MGGIGSGRRYRANKRPLVENSLAFSLSGELLDYVKVVAATGKAFEGRWNWSRGGRPAGEIGLVIFRQDSMPIMALSYSSKGQPVSMLVKLESTPAFRGMRRWWFLCPGCERRVKVLYGGLKPEFVCRTCLNLTYESSNASRKLPKFW